MSYVLHYELCGLYSESEKGLPSKYIIKVINDEVTTHTSDNFISDRLFTSTLTGVWSQNKTVIIITTITSLLALVSLVLLKNLAKNRKKTDESKNTRFCVLKRRSQRTITETNDKRL